MSGSAYDKPFWRQLLTCLVPFRKPDFIIGTPESPYMLRWWIIPRNRWFNIYLHKIVRDDDDRALHDHPWKTVSFYLRGKVRERYVWENSTYDYVGNEFIYHESVRELSAPNVVYRSERFRHCLELVDGKPCWTLFCTGLKVQEWGFWCPKGFVPWYDFVDQNDVGNIGRGCGEKS